MATSFHWVFNRFDEYETQMKNAVREGLRDSAYEVESKAVGRAPFKTGNLRNSIGSQLVDDTTARVYADAEYSLYQEDRPYYKRYLRNSLDEVVPTIAEKIRRHTPGRG